MVRAFPHQPGTIVFTVSVFDLRRYVLYVPCLEQPHGTVQMEQRLRGDILDRRTANRLRLAVVGAGGEHMGPRWVRPKKCNYYRSPNESATALTLTGYSHARPSSSCRSISHALDPVRVVAHYPATSSSYSHHTHTTAFSSFHSPHTPFPYLSMLSAILPDCPRGTSGVSTDRGRSVAGF